MLSIKRGAAFFGRPGVEGNPANHVHSIIRDPGNDYGHDWLGKHCEEHHERR